MARNDSTGGHYTRMKALRRTPRQSIVSVFVTLPVPQVTLTLKLPAAAFVAIGQDQVTAPDASAVASLEALDLAPGRAERVQVAPGEVTARMKAVVPRCAAAGNDVTL